MANIYNAHKTDYNKTVFNYCATKGEFVESIKILGGYIMKKKLVSVMMTAIMVVTLAACGSSGGGTTLTLPHRQLIQAPRPRLQHRPRL